MDDLLMAPLKRVRFNIRVGVAIRVRVGVAYRSHDPASGRGCSVGLILSSLFLTFPSLVSKWLSTKTVSKVAEY